MGLFKRAHVRGIAHELTRQGLTTWPSKMAEEETADAVADDLGEEEVPEVTDEGGLTPEQASAVVQKLVEVADEIAAKTGGARDLGVNKIAASMTYEDAASTAAVSLMQKAAAETSAQTGPDVPGTGAPAEASGATSETALDASKVPSAERVGPKGTSDFSTAEGAVGKEKKQEPAPGTVESQPSGEVAKLSALLKHMAAMDGASLSGGDVKGPAPTPRTDLSDNLNIPGAVASSRGGTGFEIPEAAMVGQIKKQPAGTPGQTAPTPNDVAADAKKASAYLTHTPEGRALLKKLSEEACEEEKKDEKKSPPAQFLENIKKDDEKKEEAKEAQIHEVVSRLASLLK
jgi:hypothetical protein